MQLETCLYSRLEYERRLFDLYFTVFSLSSFILSYIFSFPYSSFFLSSFPPYCFFLYLFLPIFLFIEEHAASLVKKRNTLHSVAVNGL
jgi:hypothetical protein